MFNLSLETTLSDRKHSSYLQKREENEPEEVLSNQLKFKATKLGPEHLCKGLLMPRLLITTMYYLAATEGWVF